MGAGAAAATYNPAWYHGSNPGGFGDRIGEPIINHGEVSVAVPAANYLEVMRQLRDDPAFRFEQLMDLSGIDYSEFTGYNGHEGEGVVQAIVKDGVRVDHAVKGDKVQILLNQTPFYGESGDMPRILAPVRVPSLHITCTEDDIRIPGFYSDVKDRIDLFAATGSAHKLLVVFREGSHSMFTDRLGTGGAGHNPAVKQATRELVVAFLDEVLYREPRGLNAWKQAHAALVTSVAGSAMP